MSTGQNPPSTPAFGVSSCSAPTRPSGSSTPWPTRRARDEATGDRLFYNRWYLSDDEKQVYRPANGARSTVWRHDADRGLFILADSDGHEHATFASHDAIFSDADPYPATESDRGRGGDDWKRVKRPIISEQVFDGDPRGTTCGTSSWSRSWQPIRRTWRSSMGRQPRPSRCS